MSKNKRIVVRGKQRAHLDAELLVQVLLAISQDWASAGGADEPASIDAFNAAIEDRGERA